MKFLDVLRKLGILRYGAKTETYTSMKDRPAEFSMEGVFNAEKDLVNQEDVKNAAAAVNSLGGRKVLFWMAVLLGAFFLVIFYGGSGFTAWFLADLILWGSFIAVLRQFAFEGRYSYAMMTLFLVVLVFASFIFLGAAAPKLRGAVGSPPLPKPPPKAYLGKIYPGGAN